MMDSRSAETCRVLYQNKLEKQSISLAFIIRVYHNAQSSECQIIMNLWVSYNSGNILSSRGSVGLS